jgi:hypothetical protein
MGVFEESGIRTQHRRDHTESAIEATSLEKVGPQETTEWPPGQIPHAGAAASLIQVLGSPSGIAIHFIDLMGEVSIGDVIEVTSEESGLGD